MTHRIVLVNSMYTRGMGYLENCLPAALARLGHDVHVVTSTFNQYANEPMYDENYADFVGPRQVAAGTSEIDGYTLTRLEASLVRGYVRIKGLSSHVSRLRPDLALRESLGFGTADVVCMYSGRFADNKNPLLARAIEQANAQGHRFRGMFIGQGRQADAIASCPGSTVIPFMPYADLPRYYRAADIGLWPRQESMSMLDAAATALPLIVSDTMSDPSRIAGNGITYREDSLDALTAALIRLSDPATRRELGDTGRRRMVAEFSWLRSAQRMVADFERGTARGRG